MQKKYQPFSLHWQNWYHKNCFSIHRIFFQKILKIELIVYILLLSLVYGYFNSWMPIGRKKCFEKIDERSKNGQKITSKEEWQNSNRHVSTFTMRNFIVIWWKGTNVRRKLIWTYVHCTCTYCSQQWGWAKIQKRVPFRDVSIGFSLFWSTC